MTNKMNMLVRVTVAGVVLLAGFSAVNSVNAQTSNVANEKAIVVVNDTPLPTPMCMPGDRGCREVLAPK